MAAMIDTNGRTAHLLALMKKGDDAFNAHNNDVYPVQFGSGDWITVITRATGTFAGEMLLPDGTVIAPTGRKFDVDFATIAKWDGDMMIEEYVFWDSALQAQQIGFA